MTDFKFSPDPRRRRRPRYPSASSTRTCIERPAVSTSRTACIRAAGRREMVGLRLSVESGFRLMDFGCWAGDGQGSEIGFALQFSSVSPRFPFAFQAAFVFWPCARVRALARGRACECAVPVPAPLSAGWASPYPPITQQCGYTSTPHGTYMCICGDGDEQRHRAAPL